MTRDEFMIQALASGKPKEEIQRIYAAADSAGDFDDNQISGQPQPQALPAESTPFSRMQQNANQFVQATGSGSPFAHPVKSLEYILQNAGELASIPNYYLNKAVQATGAPQAAYSLGQYLAGTKAGQAALPVAQIPYQAGQQAGALYHMLPENVQRDVGAAANIAGAIPTGYGSLKATGAGLEAAGQLAKNTAVGMTARGLALKAKDIKAIGGELENANKIIDKYNLAGYSPKAFHQAANQQIADASNSLNAVLAGKSGLANDIEHQVDLNSAIKDARKAALSNTRLEKASVNKAFDELQNDLAENYKPTSASSEGDLNFDNIGLTEAQQLKRETGTLADWNSNAWNQQGNATKGNVYNYFYNALRKQLEDKGGPEVKELNQKMSNLIALDRAAVKRMIVANRKEPISLKDAIGLVGAAASGHMAPLAIVGANMASTSPTVARALYGTGKGLQSLGQFIQP